VSGARSPVPPSFETLKTVKDAIKLPVLIGSGIGLANVKEFYKKSDGVLLGETDFKLRGVWGGASDRGAYAKAVKACKG
jgi:predicted TIM-barrel enzyme